MKLRPLALGFTFGILWALSILIVGAINLKSPPYGAEMLKLASSLYPGYDYGQGGFGEVIIGALYGLLDGIVCGIITAWLYNVFAKKR